MQKKNGVVDHNQCKLQLHTLPTAIHSLQEWVAPILAVIATPFLLTHTAWVTRPRVMGDGGKRQLQSP